MLFRVENLGPLREAEVDLGKNLIVLAGPNNTGKTYLAWSVYGLHSERLRNDNTWEDPVLQAFMDPKQREFDILKRPPNWQNILTRVASECRLKLASVFASNSDVFGNSRISLRHTQSSEQVTATVLNETRPMALADSDLTPEEQSFALNVIIWLVLFPNTVVFPAERIALNIFAKELALKHSEIVSDLAEAMLQKNPREIIQRRAGRYAWPIRDNLQVANDLANLSKNTSQFSDLADDLERAVLGGKISVSELGDIVFAPDRANDQRIAVHLTASVVKSLASLVFYFRHLAKENDFLIIDEPELNLHPDAQRLVTRVLAKAVNRGFKIMMSTHSDYVLRELNHLVMLSDPKESVSRLVGELGYDRASILPPEKIGVYLFKDQTAKEVPVTLDGFEVETIEREIAKLNADAQAIYSARFE